MGERMEGEVPGIYCVPERRRSQAEGYRRFVDVCSDGVLWAAMLELLADRTSTGARKTVGDQWVPRLV